MKPVDFLYLSQEDVIALNVPLAEVSLAVERALIEHANKTVEMPPKPGVHPTYENTFIHAMPAYLKGMDACGIKWVGGFPRNHEYDLPNISGLIVLNDTHTGIPLSVMDCRWVTTVRTALVSSIAARCCANPKPSALAVVGAGLQGRYHALAITHALPGVSEIRCYDVFENALKRFQGWVSPWFKGKLVMCSDPGPCVRGADIIATCTPGDKAIVQNDWFKPGATGIGIEGACAWEIDATRGADKFIVDDIPQARYFEKLGDFPGGLRDVYAELGDVVAGHKKGRDNPNERVLVTPLGLAVEDIAVAQVIYQKALERGAGTRLPLMSQEL